MKKVCFLVAGFFVANAFNNCNAAHAVSSCAFAGKNLETLYTITASVWMNAGKLKEFPLCGALFSVKPGICGIAAEFYKGKLNF